MTLRIGSSGGASVRISDEERSRHMHIIGASGTGKSRLLESLVRQDIRRPGRGLCLIDPHGTLASSVTAWCASTGMHDFRRIHVVRAADLSWTFGFNPLRVDDELLVHARVDATVAAFAQVWGGEDTNATPLLKRSLRAIFHVLAVQNLTLTEAMSLVDSSEVGMRRRLTEDLQDPLYASLWRNLCALPQRLYFEQFSSTLNRVFEFLSAPPVRRILGQRENTLDLRKSMDEGDILIFDLSGAGLSTDNSRLIGTLLTSELFLAALGRDPAMAKRHPFTLYLDECHRFLTDDISGMLDETRKFGLHLVLSHQRLGQLGKRDSAIYNGVMAGGQTKIVFGGLDDDDGALMARQIMRSTFNLERPKHVLDKPTVVADEVIWLKVEGQSQANGFVRSFTDGVGGGSSSGEIGGMSETFDLRGNRIGTGGTLSLSNQHSDSWMNSSTFAESQVTTESSSEAQTLRSVRKILPTAVYSLEEELHRAIVALREMPNRSAVIKRRGHRAQAFETKTILPALTTPAKTQQFLATTRSRSQFIGPAEAADGEIALRAMNLGRSPQGKGTRDESYWSLVE